MNYYQRHIGDYARDAKHLSMLEHGAYTILLDHYYVNETGIKNDENLYKLMQAKTKEEKAAIDYVLKNFFILKKNHWINRRAEEELKKIKARIGIAKKNGRSGGRPMRQEICKNLVTEKNFEKEKSEFSEKNANENLPILEKPIFDAACSETQSVTAGFSKETDSVIPGFKNQTHGKATQPPVNPVNQYPVFVNTESGGNLTTLIGEICVALKKQEIGLVNPSHPKFLALIENGATIKDFIDASKIAKNKEKGFAYLLGIVEQKSKNSEKKAFSNLGRHHGVNKTNIDDGVREDGSF